MKHETSWRLDCDGSFNSLCHPQVTSHEIAASTAQLVAASRVKADKDSENFGKVCIDFDLFLVAI